MGNDQDFTDMLAFVTEPCRVPVVDRVISLSQGLVAFERMDQPLQVGKIVLKV